MTAGTVVITNWRDNFHPQAGGAENCCGEVARLLAAEGRDVVYLTSAVRGRPSVEEVNGYRIIRRGGQFTVYAWALWWLACHRRSVVGVIDSQNGIPFFTPLALPGRVPIILLLHHVHQTQFAQYFSKPAAFVGRWLERVACRLVYRRRALAAMSPSTRRDARQTLGLKGPIHVVPPGLTTTRFGRSIGDRSPTPRIVCVGRMVHHKRYETIVRALPAIIRQRPDVELHLVGDGPERGALERLVDGLGIRDAVCFYGSVPSVERDAIMRTAWLTINASAGEGWGLSVVEANALGVPVVAFRVSGLRDSIRDGETGWLVDERGDLAATVIDALARVEAPSDAEDWGRSGVEWAQSFTWEETTRLLGQLLRAEAARLNQPGPERRTLSDLAVRASIPTERLPAGWTPGFRGTDRCAMGDAAVTVLLPGCDTVAAQSVMARAGLAEGVRFDLARLSDHVVVARSSTAERKLPAQPGVATLRPDGLPSAEPAPAWSVNGLDPSAARL